ncbi:hypothetical protein LguiB_034601 [Lonicera macranthoides]
MYLIAFSFTWIFNIMKVAPVFTFTKLNSIMFTYPILAVSAVYPSSIQEVFGKLKMVGNSCTYHGISSKYQYVIRVGYGYGEPIWSICALEDCHPCCLIKPGIYQRQRKERPELNTLMGNQALKHIFVEEKVETFM